MINEDCELQDLVKQTLEKSGSLSKIRADLRASVFEALKENGSLQNLQLRNDELENFAKNADGMLLFNLVKEFLDYFKLSYTTSVLEPELASYGIRCNCKDHMKLYDQLNLSPEAIHSGKGPILYQMLQIIRHVKGETCLKNRDSFSNDHCHLQHCKSSTDTSTERYQMQSSSSLVITSKESDRVGKKDESRNPFSNVNKTFDARTYLKNSSSETAIQQTDFSQQSSSSLRDLPPFSSQTNIRAGRMIGPSSKSSKEIDKLKELLIDTSLSDHKGDSSCSSAITDDEKQQFEDMNEWVDSSLETDVKFT